MHSLAADILPGHGETRSDLGGVPLLGLPPEKCRMAVHRGGHSHRGWHGVRWQSPRRVRGILVGQPDAGVRAQVGREASE